MRVCLTSRIGADRLKNASLHERTTIIDKQRRIMSSRLSWATSERMATALRHYRECHLCEHHCGIDRSAGELGPCKASDHARVFRHRIEYSEEAELIPSHLFYLSGCDLRCVFCIAEVNAFDPKRGELLTVEFFQRAVDWGQARGARTLQWLGGEPTIHLPAILQVMAECTNMPPVVWKSDFHATPESLALLNGVVDVYLADFKFGNDACAKRLAHIENYTWIVTRNLQQAVRQGDVIVRHLLLPGHFDCCYRPIVHWMKKNLPATKFSVREGYMPRWQAQHYAELTEPLADTAGSEAFALANQCGLNVIV